MMAVVGLINIKGIMHAWHAQKYDGAVAIISFIFTLAFAPHLDKGIMIGVGLSLGHYLFRNMKPRIAVLSRTVQNSYRDADLLNLPRCDYMTIIRFDGSLFFANTSYLEDQILERVSAKKLLKQVFIVGHGINELDATGEEMLSMLIDRLRDKGIEISFIGIKLQVYQVMQRTHLVEKIGENNFYQTLEQAIASVYESLHIEGHEQNCPLQPLNSLY
jgi:MFS superfamily sulfate permease-like transporter